MRKLFPRTFDVPTVDFQAGSGEGEAQEVSVMPVKVGVVLSGGQAPGGHNVIAGIFDAIKRWHPDSTLIGFLDGPHGIYSGNFSVITEDIMDGFRNTGGFDMLGSGRHKIETDDQFRNAKEVCAGIGLHGLVVIGGDDSNTNAALLAEYFLSEGCQTKVIGVPKTIDGDLKCPPHIPVSFGFDTACKTYATLVGNVAVDALSAQKYYHLVRLMGRSASNIALEVALLTRPNACLLGEEIAQKKQTLRELTNDLADMVEQRSKDGKNYGVIVLPEGIIEFIPEFRSLISEINDILSAQSVEPTETAVLAALSAPNAACFRYLPEFIRKELLLDRDPHGNVQVAKIETEKLLAATISTELENRRAQGSYSGTFKTQFHSYGYEGRAALPTIFDSSYCYALGSTAAALVLNGRSGLITSVTNLLAPVSDWHCGGVPIASLCVMEHRKGKDKPVIRKSLVDLEGACSQPFQAFKSMRESLRLFDAYVVPGPVQFDLISCPVAKDLPMMLQLELGVSHKPLGKLRAPTKMGDFLHLAQTAETRSELQQWRMKRRHRVPAVLAEMSLAGAQVVEGRKTTRPEQDALYMRKFFKVLNAPIVSVEAVEGMGHRVPSEQVIGVVFCGRQAPGCHDLLCGMVDMLKGAQNSKILGFIGGTRGLFQQQAIELTPELCKAYVGTGGLELLGRTVDRIKSESELEQALSACKSLGLTGLVLVGGARTATDAAYVAEHFKRRSSNVAIVGVPCGIEGNMINEFTEASIGFDSAAKAMSQLVGSTAIDGSSARKYYYFLRIMDGAMTAGKISSSHLALEAALQTKPNMLLLTEEVDEKRMSLRDLVKEVADVVAQRAADGKNFGTILVAEGLLAGIPEFRNLISELNALSMPSPIEEVLPQLTQWSRALLQSLPDFIQEQLLAERQSNNTVQLAQLETERLLATLVGSELKIRKAAGTYRGNYSSVCQFLGYQVRCSVPSNFDSDYAYALGGTSVLLAAAGLSGYMAVVSDLAQPVQKWRVGGVPFTAMLSITASNLSLTSQPRPAIFPRRVDLEGAGFKQLCKDRTTCTKEEWYQNPGPIQLSGPTADQMCSTIATRFSYLSELEDLKRSIDAVADVCLPGVDPKALRVATQSLRTLNTILRELTGPLESAQHPGLSWWSATAAGK
eukprot:TRINITY_DN22413_c0_g2_i1.p1 TRINITY_DN22413_c0_g2~~TRINITY_DN22413_c0_g2_i1.p1  ORF type:complete len:1239 (-),score=204.19 TRINITY_DN22413_c0_g2_i1:275-3730(-)